MTPPLAVGFFKAIVYKPPRSRAFVGYGDADPSNVSPLVRGAELRVAETRAVNRALRKAYDIGLCPVQEITSFAVGVATTCSLLFCLLVFFRSRPSSAGCLAGDLSPLLWRQLLDPRLPAHPS